MIFKPIHFLVIKGNIEQKIELLEQYLNNYNPDTIVIFTLVDEKIDSRKKICKLISKIGKVYECNSPKNINSLVKEMFLNYNIDNKTIELLIDRVGNNLNLIYIVDDDMISKVPDFIKYKEDIIKISNLEECIQKIEY